VGLFTVELRGQDQVLGTLSRFRTEAVAGVKAVVAMSALNVQTNAKGRCPVDTGRLRSSIRAVFVDGGLGASVETNVKYAPFVEYGTGRLGAASGVTPGDGYTYGPSKGSRAQPFLFPAWDLARPQFVEFLEAALDAAADAAS